jgi:tetratricopeptide (TPR) repeat protein
MAGADERKDRLARDNVVRSSTTRTLAIGAIERTILVIIVVLSLTSGAIGQDGARNRPSYADVVQRYREGQFEEALSQLRTLSERRLEAEADALVSRTMELPRRLELIEAMIALHTEVYLRQDRSLSNRGPTAQVVLAQQLVDRLRRVREPGSFERCWYLLVGAHLQALNEFDASEKHLSEARRLFPNDADLLVTIGIGREVRTRFRQQSTWGSSSFGNRQLVTGSRDVRADLDLAANFFRNALAIAPNHLEARLRLGRVLHQLGDVDGAAHELELARNTEDQVVLYLANLFAASVEEDRGDRREAADLYLAALKIHSVGQAPYIGLSELFYADGQSGQSKRVIQQLFDRPPGSDPWFIYLMGAAWHVPALLDQMRAMVRE